MKSIVHNPGLSPAFARARHWFEEIPSVAIRVLRKTGHVLAAAHQTAQRARLAAVLANLSDDQLRQIGITRSEIWTHVEKITADEYDGL